MVLKKMINWVLSVPDGPHVGPMNLALRVSSHVAVQVLIVTESMTKLVFGLEMHGTDVVCKRTLSYLTVYPKKYAHGFVVLCFVVVMQSGLLQWHCGNSTIAPVPAKQPWWIWINTSCGFIMNDCITTTKQSTTKPCAYFVGYTVVSWGPGRVGVHAWYGMEQHHLSWE